MRSRNRSALPDWKLLLAPSACLLAVMSASAAEPAPVPKITSLTVVNYQQQGSAPSGPMAVVVEHDPGLATHTIYRPKDLGNTKHGVLVWGEGGCAKNGLTFPEYLSEIASYGFVILADGPPIQRAGGPGPGAGGPGGPPPGAGGPGGAPGARPGGAPGAGGPGAGGPGAGGPRPGGGAPAGMGNMTDGTALVQAIDWIEKESRDSKSRFFNKVNVQKVAAMGMSCGGLMSYGAAGDKRVSTVGIWNSGLFDDETNSRKKYHDSIHGSVLIITGGESDIAYANGKKDFETLPKQVPVFYGVYPSIGHGGTYNQDNGGPFGKVAVPWLKWQLNGDKGATGMGYFVGESCVPCKDSNWQVQSRGLK
jgi:hypothetical protein